MTPPYRKGNQCGTSGRLAPFTLSPAEHVAILAGPVLEIALTGKQSRLDYDEVLFGLMLGLIGWVDL